MLYRAAAYNLRANHGVPSITQLSLKKAVTLLGLRPSRLVSQGLVSQWPLEGQQPQFQQQQQVAAAIVLEGPEGDNYSMLASFVEQEEENEEEGDYLMSDYEDSDSEDDHADGDEEFFGSRDINREVLEEMVVNNCEENMVLPTATTTTAAVVGADGGSKVVKDRQSSIDVGESLVHAALIAGGVVVRPREVSALLHSLGIDACSMVHLGLINREALTLSRYPAGNHDHHSNNYRHAAHPANGCPTYNTEEEVKGQERDGRLIGRKNKRTGGGSKVGRRMGYCGGGVYHRTVRVPVRLAGSMHGGGRQRRRAFKSLHGPLCTHPRGPHDGTGKLPQRTLAP